MIQKYIPSDRSLYETACHPENRFPSLPSASRVFQIPPQPFLFLCRVLTCRCRNLSSAASSISVRYSFPGSCIRNLVIICSAGMPAFFHLQQEAAAISVSTPWFSIISRMETIPMLFSRMPVCFDRFFRGRLFHTAACSSDRAETVLLPFSCHI